MTYLHLPLYVKSPYVGHDISIVTKQITGTNPLVSTPSVTSVLALGYKDMAWMASEDDSQWAVSTVEGFVCMGDPRNDVQINNNGYAVRSLRLLTPQLCVFDQGLSDFLQKMIVVVDNQINDALKPITLLDGTPVSLTKGTADEITLC